MSRKSVFLITVALFVFTGLVVNAKSNYKSRLRSALHYDVRDKLWSSNGLRVLVNDADILMIDYRRRYVLVRSFVHTWKSYAYAKFTHFTALTYSKNGKLHKSSWGSKDVLFKGRLAKVANKLHIKVAAVASKVRFPVRRRQVRRKVWGGKLILGKVIVKKAPLYAFKPWTLANGCWRGTPTVEFRIGRKFALESQPLVWRRYVTTYVMCPVNKKNKVCMRAHLGRRIWKEECAPCNNDEEKVILTCPQKL